MQLSRGITRGIIRQLVGVLMAVAAAPVGIASPILMLKHGVLASQTVPAAKKHRYYRVQVTSGGATVCGATKRALDEVKFRWNGTYQTNAMTASSTGTIGGISATVADTGHYATNEGWMAFGSGNFTPPDGAFWGAGPNYDPTTTNYVIIDFGAANKVAIDGWKLTANLCPIDGMRLYWSDDASAWTLIASSAYYNVSIPYTDLEYTWTLTEL